MALGGADCARGRASPQKMGRKTGEYRRKKAFAKRRLFCRISGVPTGIRTPVIAVKGRCPRPLDDGDLLAHPERFERPTLWFVARYSIQLSYGCAVNTTVLWRRKRDSNPRYRFKPVCFLSREVPSTTRPFLRREMRTIRARTSHVNSSVQNLTAPDPDRRLCATRARPVPDIFRRSAPTP